MTNYYVVELCPQGEIHYYWEEVQAGNAQEAVKIARHRKPNCDIQQVAVSVDDWE